MKKINNLYLLVDVNEIDKIVEKNEKRKFLSLPNYTLEKIDAKEMFQSIPEEYQKMVVVLHRPLTSINEAEEFITESPFDISDYTKIVEDPSKQVIRGCNHKKDIVFKTPADFKSLDEAKAFYQELKDNHIYNYYVNIISNYFKTKKKKKSKEKTLKR